MAFAGPLEDRQLIRERFGAYSDAVFQNDVEVYLACWSDECVRSTVGQELRGKDALRRHWVETWANLEKMTFFVEIGAIEVLGDRATARSYCREILQLKKGGMRKVVGVYTDELVRERGAWLFSRRAYELFMDEGKAPAGERPFP